MKITEEQAIAQGMSDVDIAFGFLYETIEPSENIDHRTPDEKLHGPVVECRMEPYHDVTVYADGYESRSNIGD